MGHRNAEIAIIGAGVIGLTTAIRLMEQGHAVRTFADQSSPDTTSDVAAAYWFPTGEPAQRVYEWGRVSYGVFQELATDPESGVVFRYLNKLSHDPLHDPPYLDIINQFERLDCSTLPGNYADGLRMRVPLISTPIYMAWLMHRFDELGGQIEPMHITELDVIAGDYSIIANCAGAWAGKLANDPDCYPLRGQIVRIRKPAGLSPDLFSMLWQGESTYIVPRQNDCVLGGTKQRDNWDRKPDALIAAGILRRCAEFNPLLRNPEIIEHKVGIRPGRDSVRLEAEPLSERCTVIHNYGHGEDGHGMAWGCAAEVAALVEGIAV